MDKMTKIDAETGTSGQQNLIQQNQTVHVEKVEKSWKNVNSLANTKIFITDVKPEKIDEPEE